MDNRHIFVGLDIGTDAIRVAVGSADQQDMERISIEGVSSKPNKGMRKGMVVHPEEVAQRLQLALEEAERITGRQIKSATVNVNGAHVGSIQSKGVVAISNQDHIITDEDRYRVEDASTIMQMPPNREIIQLFAQNYLIDGQAGVKNPVGMEGIRLEVESMIMTASAPMLKMLDNLTNQAGLKINHHTTSSLAAAEAVLSRSSRESGSAVLDIGSETSNLVVFDEGEVVHVAVIPIGSFNVTKDLAICLRTELEVAEKIKQEYVDLASKARGSKQIKYQGQTINFSLEDVNVYASARIEELAELVDEELQKVGYSKKLPGGIVLSGGGSKLSGLVDFLKDQFDLPVRKGHLTDFSGLVETANKPEYHTAVGLMVLDMLLSGAEDRHLSSNQLDSLSLKLKTLFKRKK